MKRRRIALVSRELAPFVGGGIGTYAQVMARSLAAAGHEVHLVTGAHDRLAERAPALLPGVTVHAVEVSAGAAKLEAYPHYPQRHAMAVFEKLRMLHAATPFDLIEFPEYWGEGYFALRARRHLGEFEGAVLVVRLHTPSRDVRALNREAWFDREAACLDHMEGFCIRHADAVVSPTQSLLERTAGRMKLPAVARLARNPWDEWFASAGSAPNRGRAIVYVGRLERRKGVDLLVDAWQRLASPPALVLIGGDTPTGPQHGSMQRYLERRIPAALRGQVRFAGHLDREEIAQQLRAAAVCCFPSRWENLPYTVLEAMSLGAAIVGSDAGGMAELLEDGKSGVLFRSEDVGSLQGALTRLLEDDSLNQRVRLDAPRRVRELCDPAVAVGQLLAAADEAEPFRPSPAGTTHASPAVSVIIPCFNTGEFLEQTVASVRAQTFTDHELILVDDGSTDPATLEVLAKLEHEGLRRVTKQNGGLSSARNAGLAVARGKWVLPLDSDDVIEPTYLERTVTALRRDPKLAFATTLVRYFAADASPGTGTTGWIPWGLERDALAVMNIASVSTALLAKDLVLELGGYDEWMLFEDWDLYARMALRGLDAAVIPEFLFNYRMRSTSIMHAMEVERRHRLQAELLEKYPGLPQDPSRAARLLLAITSEVERQVAEEKANPPLRHRVVDALNSGLKRLPGHGTFKHGVNWLLGHAETAGGKRR